MTCNPYDLPLHHFPLASCLIESRAASPAIHDCQAALQPVGGIRAIGQQPILLKSLGAPSLIPILHRALKVLARLPALAGADMHIGIHIASIPLMSHPVKQNPAPLLPLLSYQRDYLADASRFKIWLASRQIGKSWAAALEAVIDCMVKPGAHWVILSAGERQALEFMEKVRQHARAIGLAISGFADETAGGTIYKSAEVRFANGSRITALPANPDTARGYSANIILDEFALHQDAEAIWRAIYPTITNPMRGELKARVLSTPNGQGNKFHQLWNDALEPGSQWSAHRTTIHDAIAAGLAVNLDQLRRAAGDPATWEQEFECVFLDSGGVLFPYETITRAESPLATEHWPQPEPDPGLALLVTAAGSNSLRQSPSPRVPHLTVPLPIRHPDQTFF